MKRGAFLPVPQRMSVRNNIRVRRVMEKVPKMPMDPNIKSLDKLKEKDRRVNALGLRSLH